jgi:hypothetical protein
MASLAIESNISLAARDIIALLEKASFVMLGSAALGAYAPAGRP